MQHIVTRQVFVTDRTDFAASKPHEGKADRNVQFGTGNQVQDPADVFSGRADIFRYFFLREDRARRYNVLRSENGPDQAHIVPYRFLGSSAGYHVIYHSLHVLLRDAVAGF